MRILQLLLSIGIAFAARDVTAQEGGTWTWRAGIHSLEPGAASGALDIQEATSLTVAVTRHLSPRWAIELLGSAEFSHDLSAPGEGRVAEIHEVIPTLTVQYRFPQQGWLRPYAGVGINYTAFFDERTMGSLATKSLDLQASWGIALQAGIEFDLNRRWFFSCDARWFEMQPRATLSGTEVRRLRLDPYALGVAIGRRF